MDTISHALPWIVLQLTLLASIAWMLYFFLGQRTRRGVSIAVGSLTLGTALGLLAIMPMSINWFEMEASESSTPAMSSDSHSQNSITETASTEPTVTFAIGQLLQTFRGQIHASLPDSNTIVWQWIGWLFLVGVGLSLLRFLYAVYHALGYCRRSHGLSDETILTLSQTLAEQLGIQAEVSIRQSNELTSAAVVGWWRPVILLPSCWRQWSELELRTVLAHELAHVARRDYLIWLLARLSMIVHFYHPLAHWLFRRLQLEQEFAADALGAELVGGQRRYLYALSRLAIRQDELLSTPLSARAFLPTTGTLIRRIGMLKRNSTKAGRAMQLMTWAVMVCVAVAASTLRGDDKEKTTPTSKAKASQVKPLTLDYLSKNAPAHYAFNPSAFLRHKNKPRFSEKTHRTFDKLMLDTFNLKAITGLTLSEIDQVSGSVVFSVHPDKPKGHRRSISFSLRTIRAAHPHDWKKHLGKVAGSIKEFTHKGKKFYRIANANSLLNSLAPFPMYFYLPDDRMLVIGSEKEMKDIIETKPRSHSGLKSWKSVDQCMFAMAITPKGKLLEKEVLKDSDLEMHFATVLKAIDQGCLGLSWDESWSLHGTIYTRKTSSTIKVKRALPAICKILLEEAKASKAEDKKKESAQLALYKLLEDLLTPSITWKDNVAVIHGQSKADIRSLIEKSLTE